MFNRKYIFKRSISHCCVSLPECTKVPEWLKHLNLNKICKKNKLNFFHRFGCDIYVDRRFRKMLSQAVPDTNKKMKTRLVQYNRSTHTWGIKQYNCVMLLMEEILHQLIGSLSHVYPIVYKVYTSQVVQDFFHRQQVWVIRP